MRFVFNVSAMFALTLLAGCNAPTDTAPKKPAAAVASDAPGTIVDLKPYSDIDQSIKDIGADALRVTYRSTSSDGQHTVVTGALFVPAGTPPAGGWPILAHAHGTTGITNDCGPSSTPNLSGMVPMFVGYLKAGYAVALADYQGLGGGGNHVYLDNKTEGYNVIDSVRALRNAKPGVVSDKWVALGGSQGGGASWAAAEYAPVYAPELHMVAAVNAVPAANIAGYAQLAEDQAMTPVQSAAYTAILITQFNAHPELNKDDYRRGSVTTNIDALGSCKAGEARNKAIMEIKPDELKPASHEATLKLQGLLQAMAVPQRKTDVPMLVIYAGKDEYISAPWTKKAIEDACAMGTKIDVDFEADKSHGTFENANILPWLKDRLDGKPLTNSCQTTAAN